MDYGYDSTGSDWVQFQDDYTTVIDPYTDAEGYTYETWDDYVDGENQYVVEDSLAWPVEESQVEAY